MSILVFDNYDSFTYNLVHYIEKVSDVSVLVRRNNEVELEELANFDKILLSPGPGLPSQAGILLDVIRTYSPSKSILGVCLGHQAIAEVFGGTLSILPQVYHGVASPVNVTADDYLFNNIPRKFNAGRYHSWTVDKNGLPQELEVIAEDEAGNIMALRHKKLDLRSVQFHPESVLTEHGLQLIRNWLEA